MIAVDTSILVRYVTQDDPEQSRLANTLFESELTEQNPGYLTLVALAEFHWVLSRAYRAATAQIAEAIRLLLASPTIVVELPDVVEAALAQERGDFADRLIHQAGLAAGCTSTVTFDRRFGRLAGVTVLKAG